MSAIPPGSVSSGASTGGDTGTSVALAQAIESLIGVIGGLQGTLTTLTEQAGATQVWQKQVADGLNNFSQNIANLTDTVHNANASTSDADTNTTVRFTSVVDPGDNMQRMMLNRDQVNATVLKNLANMVENGDALMKAHLNYFTAKWSSEAEYQSGAWARSLDHFGALPPIAPRSPTGPGNTAG